MAPKKGKESPLELCHRATLLGNSISVRMLEYLSTAKNHPHGFRELATDFLDICRILWSIEAGLTEASRKHNQFPLDMVYELDKKFRQTNDDFIVLNQMLLRYLDYEKKGGFGRLQKGWRMMFADSDIEKIRDSLGKSRDALRMSALVFRWSLGDAQADASVGIGYTGLVAALERMNQGRPTTVIPPLHHHPQPQHDAPELPPQLPPVPLVERTSVSNLMPRPDDTQSRHGDSHSRHDDTQSRIGDSHSRHDDTQSRHGDSHSRHDDALSALPGLMDRDSRSQSIGWAASTRSSELTAYSAARDSSFHKNRIMHAEIPQEDNSSDNTTESRTLIEDRIQDIDLDAKYSNQVVRLKADPATVPRWTPRQTAGGNSTGLKAALINAVQQKKHKMIEQLLDSGVPVECGLEINLLREAVMNRDAESVRMLLLFGADSNSFDKEGYTPLFSATEISFLEGAKMLIKYGADANLSAGPDSESPLSLAVTRNRVEFVQLYLMYGGDMNLVMANGNTVFIKAMNKNSPKKLVELMLNYGCDPNAKNGEGKTPLFEAINAGRLDLMTLLLEHGADPNLPGPKHMLWPAVHQPKALQLLLSHGADHTKCSGIMELATSTNSMEAVSVLLKAGVSPNAKKDGTYTPLCSAIRDNRINIVSLLLANGADPNLMASEYPAFKCVTHNRVHLLPQLVAAGSDLNKPKGIIETAVVHNNKDAIMYLLDQGVNPNDRSDQGRTALTTAIRDNHGELVDLLLSNGADPGIRGEDWPICMAVKRPMILKKLLAARARPVKGVMEMAVVANELDSIKLLLQAGVSVEDKNGGVFSPLTTAIREDKKDIVRFLLDEAGADPKSPGEHLPLIKAIRRCRGNDTEIIEMLLERGADINQMYRGWNAVLQAVENGDSNVLRLLVENGRKVDLQVTDDSGRTVVDIVTEQGWEEAISLLLGPGEARQ